MRKNKITTLILMALCLAATGVATSAIAEEAMADVEQVGDEGPADTEQVSSPEEVIAPKELTEDSVVASLKSRYRWIKNCYQGLSESSKELVPATVTASFIISKFGHVRRLSFKEDLAEGSEIQSCFIKQLLPKKFPRPAGGKNVRIKFPVKFR